MERSLGRKRSWGRAWHLAQWERVAERTARLQHSIAHESSLFHTRNCVRRNENVRCDKTDVGVASSETEGKMLEKSMLTDKWLHCSDEERKSKCGALGV